MGAIADRLEAARKAAVESTGLVKPVASAAAASPAAPVEVKSEAVTGMLNTANLAPRNMGTQKLPMIDAMKPQKLAPGERLFKAPKYNFSFYMPNEKQVMFRHGWLATKDAEIIKYLTDPVNAKHFLVSEVKVDEKK